jgi:hypothetical protein
MPSNQTDFEYRICTAKLSPTTESDIPEPLTRKVFSGTELISKPVQETDFGIAAVPESIRRIDAR